jgi:hypothetical protein
MIDGQDTFHVTHSLNHRPQLGRDSLGYDYLKDVGWLRYRMACFDVFTSSDKAPSPPPLFLLLHQRLPFSGVIVSKPWLFLLPSRGNQGLED